MRRLAILTVLCAVAAIGAAVHAPSAMALDISDTPPPTGKVGVSYFFQFDMAPGSGSPGMTFKIASGSLPPGLRLNYEGERWARVLGTPTKAGTYRFFLQAIDIPGPWVCCTEEEYTITITDRLIVSTQSLADASINQAYGPVQLTASGGTVSSWSVASGALPPGITLSSSGVLQGTPTASGPFTFTVAASGSLGTDTKQLTIFVSAPLVLGGPGGAVPKVEPVPLNTKVNSAFAWGVAATGGRTPYTYSSSTLPVGLTLDPTTGELEGTPTVAGVTRITFTVKDSQGTTDTLVASLNVKALLAFSVGTPKSAKVGRFYSFRVPVTGASKTRIFLASGRFPPGLELNETTGVLSGRPLAAGSYTIRVWVLGDPGTMITKAFKFKIVA